MKIRMIVSFILVGLLGCQSKQISQDAQVRFEKHEIDMGDLAYKADATCSFKFSNKGNCPLLIQQVKTSCGCTVPKWTKKPIKAGKTGELFIDYDTTHPGIFRKTITVFYNGKDSPEILSISGSVEYQENI